ncbi:hypothetical protein BSKO_13467 [Bryopsis sp. KO-2023]|nr:hypothetical protein BSKO_13467 [Bryopsis sp. KO-2023]
MLFGELRRCEGITGEMYDQMEGKFKKLLEEIRVEISTQAKMVQLELEMQPTKTVEEVDQLMVLKSKEEKDAENLVVAKEKKMTEDQARIAAAQRDLDGALDALHGVAFPRLYRKDLVQLKALTNPPKGVKRVMESVCILLGVHPKPKSGKKPADYWSAAKKLLSDPKNLLERLMTFDRENLRESAVKKVQSNIQKPEDVLKIFKACAPISMWVEAMCVYHNARMQVIPKRAALKTAEEKLTQTMDELTEAQEKLKDLDSRMFEVVDSAVASPSTSCRMVERRKGAEVYLGGTGLGKEIQNSLITTPDILQLSILPTCKDFSRVLLNPGMVVLDEDYACKGVFSCYTEIPKRRLRQLCRWQYKATPSISSMEMASEDSETILPKRKENNLNEGEIQEACEKDVLLQTIKSLKSQLESTKQQVVSLTETLEEERRISKESLANAEKEIQRLKKEAGGAAACDQRDRLMPHDRQTLIKPPTVNYGTCFLEISPGAPLTVVLSPGVDPITDLLSSAESMWRASAWKTPPTAIAARAAHAKDLSTENKIITPTAKPLMINLQGQANKEMGTFNSQSYIIDMKLLNKNLLRTLGNRFQQAIFMENVKELRISSTELNPLNLCNPDFRFPVIMDVQKPHHPPEQCVKGKLTESPEVDVGPCATNPPHIRHTLPKSSPVKSSQIWSVKTDPFGTRQSRKKSPSGLSKEITENVFLPQRGDVTRDNDEWPAWNDRDLVREYCELDCTVFEPEFTLQENVRKAAVIRSFYYDLETYLRKKDLV